MTTGLDLTFDLLAQTRNEAAVGVLLPALSSGNAAVRGRAVRAILSRRSTSGVRELLRVWPTLNEQDHELLAQHVDTVAEGVRSVIEQMEESLLPAAIEASGSLALTPVLGPLVRLAQTDVSGSLRRAAVATSVALAWRLGEAARDGESPPRGRSGLVDQLAEAVRRFPEHQLDGLVDAMLSLARWDDAALNSLILSPAGPGEVLERRLVRSRAPGVVHLLAGYVCRSRVPGPARRALKARADSALRAQLLRTIGEEPSSIQLRHLGELGPLPSCVPGPELLEAAAPSQLGAALWLVAATQDDGLRVLDFALDVLERGGAGQRGRVARVLERLDGIDEGILVRAAISVIERRQNRDDPAVRSARRLLKLAAGSDAQLSKAAIRCLEPLHLEKLLQRLPTLRPASQRRLGKLVCIADPEAMNKLADELRHPVIERRRRAVFAAVAMQVVDQLCPSWEHMLEKDHRELKLAALNALAQGHGPQSLGLLQLWAVETDGPIGAAARAALAARHDG